MGRRRASATAALMAAIGVIAALPGSAAASAKAKFDVGAASVSYTPPAAGKLKDDPADCATAAQAGQYDGPRKFAFEEPFTDQNGNGDYDLGEPYLDCNGNSRWDGNYLGGGGDSPRLYDHVADPVTARAMVVGSGEKRIAVEVLDNEGAFNTYLDRIRQKVAADGVKLDGIFISSTHDESAPDTIGISGPSDSSGIPVSSVNAYFADYMVNRAALAIEKAAKHTKPAHIDYAQTLEPSNLRQCWSSYPFVDDQLMPSLRAVDSKGHTIVTLADVSQHAETLGFNPSKTQAKWISADWPNFFRQSIEKRFGGVAIEMAGSVGSNETPEVFGSPVSRVPQQFVNESHPAGCRTLFNAPNGEKPAAVDYSGETKALGQDLAAAVTKGLTKHAVTSKSSTIWGKSKSICIPLDNALFLLGASIGVFGDRTGYTNNCKTAIPPAANGSTSGDEIKSDVAAFQIGDGEFASVPGEVFPFTYLRGFQSPDDMPDPGPALPPWLVPHMHAPFRFIDGLGEDMLGYIFPVGNAVGVPTLANLDPSSTDRFGCGHSDDSEAASPNTADIAGKALVNVLDSHGGKPEKIVKGRYVLPDGTKSRDPLGSPEIKCNVDKTFNAAGPAVAVWTPGGGKVKPAAWMSLSGGRQRKPDRDTRGYFTDKGKPVWLDVFPALKGAP